MHSLQPKQTKLKAEEVKELLGSYNISVAQLPKIKLDEPAIGEGFVKGDVLKIERKEKGGTFFYYRVVA